VLTVAAALLLRSFERLRGTDLGFRRHDVLSVELRVLGGREIGGDLVLQTALASGQQLAVGLRGQEAKPSHACTIPAR
jgi:hypothetical protein